METIADLESLIITLEKEIYNAVNSVIKANPIKLPHQVKIQEICIPLINVSEVGEGYSRYIIGNPSIELDFNIGRRL